MSTLLGHSSIRPMTDILQSINSVLEKGRLGFALISREGFLRAANTIFLDTFGKKTLSLGTIPLGEIEKSFTSRTLPEQAHAVATWTRGKGTDSGGFWHGTIPFDNGSIDLFRAGLTYSGTEAAILFRKSEEGNPPKASAVDISRIYLLMSEEITTILLDSLDHETMIEGLSDSFWEETDFADPPKIFLWNTPKWQKESSLIQLTPRSSHHGDSPLTTALSATTPQKILQAISVPVSRPVFLREAGHEGIYIILPLFRETASFGWITQRLSLDMKKAQSFAQGIARIGNDLSRKLFMNREELRLISILNRDQESGLPSRRGLIDGLTDLLEIEAFRNQGVGLLGIALSDPGGIPPMKEVLVSFTRQSDLLGRVSPMEFLILLPNQTRSGTERASRRLEAVIYRTGTQQIRLASRISYSHAPEDGRSPIRLMRSAFMENVRTIGNIRDTSPFS